jgi:hypothetical protein
MAAAVILLALLTVTATVVPLPVIGGLAEHSLLLANAPLLAGYLSEPQMAVQLGVTVRTLWRWRKQRTGPPVTFVGRTPMYLTESAHAWLRSRERKMVREGRRSRARRTAISAESAA